MRRVVRLACRIRDSGCRQDALRWSRGGIRMSDLLRSEERLAMTWRDKLEIGLKENAAFRKDNLPTSEVSGPEVAQGPGRSAEIPRAREKADRVPIAGKASLASGTSRRSGRAARAAPRKG